jgi:hypothetical protein
MLLARWNWPICPEAIWPEVINPEAKKLLTVPLAKWFILICPLAMLPLTTASFAIWPEFIIPEDKSNLDMEPEAICPLCTIPEVNTGIPPITPEAKW